MSQQHRDKPFWMKFDGVKREDWTGQRIDVTSWEDEISFLSWTIKSFDAISNILVMVLLIIVVVGIMNALWMAIRERTGEIGTLRAIGMTRWKVLWMFNLEACSEGPCKQRLMKLDLDVQCTR